MDNLIDNLIKVNCIKKGKFKLRNGEESDIYFDLKSIISYPDILIDICEKLYIEIEKHYNLNLINSLIENHNLKICGVPIGGIPYSSYLSTKYKIPMIIVRKEKKNYGLQKQIEGNFEKKNKCIIVEDVITTGGSVKEVIDIIKDKIDILCICVIINRSNLIEIDGIKIISILDKQSLNSINCKKI